MPTQPTLIVEFAPDNGPLDDPTTWIAITDDVIRLSTQRGRDHELTNFEAGTATVVLDNSLGTYTPGNNQSTYYTRLRPMCPIRIRATWSATTRNLWRGYIERWDPMWPGGIDGELTLSCVDGFALLAKQKITATTGIQDSDDRIVVMLAYAGWPAAFSITSIDTLSIIPAIPSVTLTQTAPLAHMQDVMITEGGQMFMGTDGQLWWKYRDARVVDTRSFNVQARFGHDAISFYNWILGDSVESVLGVTTILRGIDGLPEVPYLTVSLELDEQFIINDARITIPSGVTYTATDATSIARYGTHTYAISVLKDTSIDAQTRADLLIETYKDPIPRVRRIRLSGHQGDSAWPYILYLDINDRISTVIRPAAGANLGDEHWIEGVAFTIADQTWDVEYTLSPAPIILY